MERKFVEKCMAFALNVLGTKTGKERHIQRRTLSGTKICGEVYGVRSLRSRHEGGERTPYTAEFAKQVSIL